MKNLFKKVLTGALIGAALMGKPQKADAAEVYFDAGFSANFDYNMRKPEIHLNRAIRDVPRHPDDDYALDKDVKPIKDRPLSFSPINFSLKQKIGFGLKQNLPSGFISGFDFKWGVTLEELFSYPTFTKRNYTNYPGTEQRGKGAALTYCSINQFCCLPGAYLRASYFINSSNWNNSGLNLFIEYAPEFSFINVSAGWDRYNSLQQKNESFLGVSLDHILKFGVKGHLATNNQSLRGYLDAETFVGVGFPTIIYQNHKIGEQKTFTPYFTVGVNLGLGLEVSLNPQD